MGRMDEAKPYFTKAVASYEASLGADHPNLATSLNNLAGLHRAEGDHAASLRMYTRSLAIRQKVRQLVIRCANRTSRVWLHERSIRRCLEWPTESTARCEALYCRARRPIELIDAFVRV